MEIRYRYATVEGRRVFYREAGPDGAPAIVLLHGFPSSSSARPGAGASSGPARRTRA